MAEVGLPWGAARQSVWRLWRHPKVDVPRRESQGSVIDAPSRRKGTGRNVVVAREGAYRRRAGETGVVGRRRTGRNLVGELSASAWGTETATGWPAAGVGRMVGLVDRRAKLRRVVEKWLVDGVRVVGGAGFLLAPCAPWLSLSAGVGRASLATGIAVVAHHAITRGSERGRRFSRRARADVEGWVVDREWESDRRRASLLGEELESRLVDEEGPSRDITKQYVTMAGVSLTIIVAFHEPDGANAEVVEAVRAGATSLGAAIVVGLVLLERLSGSTRTLVGEFVISILYHLMCWSLLFGVFCLVMSLWP